MMVQTSCPSCGKTGEVPAPYLGRTVGCKRCNTLFKVRSATAPLAAQEPLSGDQIEVRAENAWLDDMPPILVDLPVRRSAKELVSA
jgi:hypothetical protein